MNDESDLPDHEEKYDIAEDTLTAANQKLAKLSSRTAEERVMSIIEKPVDDSLIRVGNKIIHRRTEEEYETIWNSFLINAGDEFAEYMGYSIEDIERIGKNAFIDAFDWRLPTEVLSFKTDKIHIIPCVHCNNAFSDIEESFGLCESCKPLYDLNYFEKVIDEADKEVSRQFLAANPDAKVIPSTKTEGISEFLYNKEFRDKFLMTVLDKRDEERRNKNVEASGPN